MINNMSKTINEQAQQSLKNLKEYFTFLVDNDFDFVASDHTQRTSEQLDIIGLALDKASKLQEDKDYIINQYERLTRYRKQLHEADLGETHVRKEYGNAISDCSRYRRVNPKRNWRNNMNKLPNAPAGKRTEKIVRYKWRKFLMDSDGFITIPREAGKFEKFIKDLWHILPKKLKTKELEKNKDMILKYPWLLMTNRWNGKINLSWDEKR